MIYLVATLSRSEVTAVLNGPDDPERFLGKMLPMQRAAWIGFDSKGCESPLRKRIPSERNPALVLECLDWDPDGRHREESLRHPAPSPAPSPEMTQQLWRFLWSLQDTALEYELYVHCEQGMNRSGAVAEFVRSRLGAEEHGLSCRLPALRAEDRSRNQTILRMLEEASSSAGYEHILCPRCGRDTMSSCGNILPHPHRVYGNIRCHPSRLGW